MIGYAQQLKNYYFGKKMAAQSVPASLFFRKDEDSMGIVGMPFDLFISENHKLSFRVSDHPLQDGSTISDHVHRELQEVTIEGMFSNFSVNRSDVPDEPVEFKEDMGRREVYTTVQNTALKNLEKLRELAKKRQPVRLVCSLDVYPKMVITDVSYSRDEKSGSAIRFTVTLREIVTVKLTTTTSVYTFQPASMNNSNDRKIAKEQASGKRTAEEKEAAEMSKIINVEVSD